MRRLAPLFFFSFLVAAPAAAQFTRVSTTLVDPNGIPYAGARVSFVLINGTGLPPMLSGQTLSSPPGPVTLDQNGTFNPPIAVPDNAVITCGLAVCAPQTQWGLTVTLSPGVPLPQGTGPQTFSQVFTITGSSQTITFSGVPTLTRGGFSSVAQFSAVTFGAVYDDATDNCAAFTALAAASNAYTGPGTPSVSFAPPAGSAGKAYKLTSCNVAFTVPTTIDLGGATIDCAGSTGNCVQLGPSGLGNFINSQLSRYLIHNGTMVGGASLTVAGIEIEPFISQSSVEGMNFPNFGAGNATLGNCTNFAVKWDTPNNSLMFRHNHWWSFDSTVGRCAVSNPSDGGIGSGTGVFDDNSIEATAAPGFTAPCASQGLVEGGFQSVISHNNIYGFGVPIRMNASAAGVALSTTGTQIHHNQLDTGGCVAHGKNSVIQFGANGGSQAVGPAVIEGNITNGGRDLFGQAGDSTATIRGINIKNNISTGGGGHIFDAGTVPTCALFGAAANVSQPGCNLTGNIGYANNGFALSGWIVSPYSVSDITTTGNVANIGSTLLYTTGEAQVIRVGCTISLTTAATTSSTLPVCQVTYTDFDSNATVTLNVTPTWAASTPGCSGAVTNTVGNGCGSVVQIMVKAGTSVNYLTANYASVGGTVMAFSARLRAEVVY